MNPFSLDGALVPAARLVASVRPPHERWIAQGPGVASPAGAAADAGQVAAGSSTTRSSSSVTCAHPDAPASIAERAAIALGAVDVLVNNAATAARLDTVDTDAALIDEMLAVNVRAPLLLIAALVPSMIERGAGIDHQPVVGLGRGRNAAPRGLRGVEGRARRR